MPLLYTIIQTEKDLTDMEYKCKHKMITEPTYDRTMQKVSEFMEYLVNEVGIGFPLIKVSYLSSCYAIVHWFDSE